MPEKGGTIMSCFFIVQGHLKLIFFIKNNVFTHRLHIPRIERNHYGILDILIIVHFLTQCIRMLNQEMCYFEFVTSITVLISARLVYGKRFTVTYLLYNNVTSDLLFNAISFQ